MPFVEQTPKEYTLESIEKLIPGQMGVYGLFNANGWIYIGKGKIRERLLGHLNGDNDRISMLKPTQFTSEVFEYPEYLNPREKQLISEYKPQCNRGLKSWWNGRNYWQKALLICLILFLTVGFLIAVLSGPTPGSYAWFCNQVPQNAAQAQYQQTIETAHGALYGSQDSNTGDASGYPTLQQGASQWGFTNNNNNNQ